MLNRSLAAILVFGWVALSGFDLLEDLQPAFSDGASAQTGKSRPPHWRPHPSLVNNIVESAIGTHADYTPLLPVYESEPTVYLLCSWPRVLELHKLNRVFLI